MFSLRKLFGFKGGADNQTETLSDKMVKNKSVQYKLKKSYVYKTQMEMNRLRTAIDSAESPTMPRRLELYSLYRETMRDAHVFSNVRTLHNKIASAQFELVDASGNPDQKLKEDLLDAPWFQKYIGYFIDTHFWGHSLVELLFKNNRVENIYLVPREHVHPWSGQIVLDTGDTKGIPYRDKPFSKQFMEIGGEDDLGLLLIVTREAIWKNYSRSDWSRFSEKFGMPIIIIKTDTDDQVELDKKAEMASSFGTNSWGIFDERDDVNMLQASNTDAYKVYAELASFCDAQISKVILGQTGTTDEKSFVGSAEVHERILDTFVWAFLRGIQSHINNDLFPYLIENGYPLSGYKFRYPELDKKAEATPGQSSAGAGPQKKNLSLSVRMPWLDKKACCEHSNNEYKLADQKAVDLDKIMQAAIKKVHEKTLKKGDIDEDLWRYNVTEILKAVEKGTGLAYSKLQKGAKYYDLMTNLRENIYVFAAFKNYHNIADMVDALQDDNGKLRSFSEFKELANGISKVYNETWLETEYNTAVSNAQMAKKWQQIKDDAEDFPWLQYSAVTDDRTRAAHDALDGVTLRWDDEFWTEFYPPNGYNCRCTVLALADAEEKRPESLPGTLEVPPAFRHNAGIDGKLYSEEHPYFQSMSEDAKKNVTKAMRSMVLRENEAYKEAVERVKRKPEVFEGFKSMTADDAASLNLYTTRVFQQLNLRIRNEKLSVFELYLRDSMNEALDKLPSYKGEVYRIINTNVKPDFILKLIENGDNDFVEKAFTSASYSEEWAAKKLLEGNNKYKVFFSITSKTGKKIEQFSQKGTIFGTGNNQFEVLFKSGTKFKIVSHEITNDIILIKLEEL